MYSRLNHCGQPAAAANEPVEAGRESNDYVGCFMMMSVGIETSVMSVRLAAVGVWRAESERPSNHNGAVRRNY